MKNLFSFKELTEFNMLPGRYNRLDNHVYQVGDIEVLKLNAMYGANAAGKSNLIRAIGLLGKYLKHGNLPIEFITETFKFDNESQAKDVYLGVEFIKDEVAYYYGITLNQGIIIEEELERSGLGKKADYSLFRRTDQVFEDKLEITFSKEVMDNKEMASFVKFLKVDMVERNRPALYYMASRKAMVFEPFRKAFSWFSGDLITIMPHTKPIGLAVGMEEDSTFREFACNIMQASNTGVKRITTKTIPIEEFFGEDDREKAQRVTAELKANLRKAIPFFSQREEVVFVLNDGKAVAKRLLFIHSTNKGEVEFTAAEESDGTLRLLEYLTAFYAAIRTKQVYLIDEIERSMHPLLVKELLYKFSHDKLTQGQIIFSTHESNLLDQDMLRQDEIWFAEKNKEGATEIYPLSDFKEHHTKNIRRGYLTGRYGGIPFLGNLKDLNWEQYAQAE